MISSHDRMQKILDVASFTLSKEARNQAEPKEQITTPDPTYEPGSLTQGNEYNRYIDDPSNKFLRNLAGASLSFAPLAKPITAATKLIANDAAMQAAYKPASQTLKEIYERYSPSIQGLFNSKPQAPK